MFVILHHIQDLCIQQAGNYFDLIDWETEPCTEPPLTMDLSVDSILDCIRSPLILPPYPNHTQSVERMVRVVCEVAGQRVGYTARHRYWGTKHYLDNYFNFQADFTEVGVKKISAKVQHKKG